MSSKIPVGVQLFSFNKDVARDLPGTLQAIAKMGYQGVETAGLGNTAARKTGSMLLKDFGLGVAGAHVGLERAPGRRLSGDARLPMAKSAAAGSTRAVPRGQVHGRPRWVPPRLRRDQRGRRARQGAGCSVGYHNHDFEFRFVENRVPFALMLDCLTSDVEIQFDMGWSTARVADGAAYVRAQPGRIQDDPHSRRLKRDDAAALVGEDSVPWAAVFEACETVGGTEWYIVEHEDYGSLTPMQCIEGCLRNLRAMGK